MKKIISLLISVLFLLAIVSACSSSPTQPSMAETISPSTSASQTSGDQNVEKKIKVVTTIFPQYDFVRQIAGDNVDLSMLLTPGAESHSYEPTPQDIIDIQKSDLFIYTGGENDVWVDEILNSMGDNKPEVLKLTDCVTLVEEEIVEGMEDEHEHSHDEEESAHEEDSDHEHNHEEESLHEEDHDHSDEPEYDEHIWTSPRNVISIVNKLTDTLSGIDSNHKETFEENRAAYISQLEELDQQFQDVVDSAARKTLVFGDRFPFRYFADDYGLTYYAAFPGCSTETEPSAKTVAFLIDKVNDEQIPVVFHIELSNEKITDTICAETGAKKSLLHACHNISKEDFEQGATYLDLMNKNVSVLKEALH